MIDISDGLSSDLSHILVESGGLGAVLDESAIPIHPDARDMSRLDGVARDRARALRRRGFRALRRRAPPADAARLLAEPPARTTLFRIGEITEAPGLVLRTRRRRVLRPISPRGFDHFRTGMP